jgi:hypothetical protein
MTSRTFPFTNGGFGAFAMGHAGERVSMVLGPHAHSTSIHMSAAEARAMASALEAAATHAENVLATGLGESATDGMPPLRAA